MAERTDRKSDGNPERGDGGGLDLDLPRQRRSWVIQRCAWIAMTLILVAALAGFFGRGPVAHRSVRSDDGSLRVVYDRFARLHAPLDLRIAASRPAPLRIRISKSYLNNVEVLSIVPWPQAQLATDDGIEFVFAAEDGTTEFEAVLRFKVQEAGSLAGDILLPSSESHTQAGVRIRQFAYP